MKKTLALCSSLLLLASCQSTRNIDTENDNGSAVMALDYRDFESASSKMSQSLIESGAVNRQDGRRSVATLSTIKNDTMQRIDTDQLTKKIRATMMRTGKLVFSTAISANGAEDKMIRDVRTLRTDDEFAQQTVQQKHQLIAPDFSLSGKILQRNIRMDSGKTQVEYYFMMSLTDLKTGLATWENEVVLGKRGKGKYLSW